MYNKIKYLVYISFALFLVLSTVMLSTLSEKHSEKNSEKSANIETHKNIDLYENTDTKEKSRQPEELQRSENEGNITDNLDFAASSAEKKPEDNNKIAKKDPYFIIRSSKFDEIKTNDKNFGLKESQDYSDVDSDGNNDTEMTAAAQILDDSNILLYIFSSNDENNTVLWQKKITNKAKKEITPTDLTFDTDKLSVTIQESESQAEVTFVYEIDKKASNNTSLVLKLKENEIIHPEIVNPDKTEAKDFVIVDTFKINEQKFHIVGYSDFKNTSEVSNYVKRNFYLYKQNGKSLQYCCFLFSRLTLKDDEIFEMITIQQDKSKIMFSYNGKDNGQKTIYKSKLVGQYASFPNGRRFALDPKTVVENSNYDLKIIEIYN